MEQIPLLAVALVVILIGAELFTNGIEWVGHHLDLAEGAVGSVLAAVGTALPETMIPLVAILLGGGAETSEASDHIGVGAILGAPFMLATLAMFITGAAVVVRARRRPDAGDRMSVDTRVLGKDAAWFLAAYGLAVGAAFLPSDAGWARIGIACALVGMYALYVRAHFAAESAGGDGTDLAPLRLHRLDRAHHRAAAGSPRLRVVWVQVVVALSCIVIGAVAFVDAVEHLATGMGVAPVILSLVIAPIATELPEKFNSVIWIRAGKDTLAMGNITGAMVFQSCIPTVIGLVFASSAWRVDATSPESLLAFASAGIAFLATLTIFLPMWRSGRLRGRGLMMGGVFYGAYLALVIGVTAGGV